MDIAGNNRYELLFMDDESTAPPALGESTDSKKKHSNNLDQVKRTLINAKKNTEKENKSGALNKNETSKKSSIKAKPKLGASVNATDQHSGAESDSRRVAFKSQNIDMREQRNGRRNFREGGDFGQDEREPRQARDRDNRPTGRNRDPIFRVGKREFDRQSGSDKTGVKSIDKRDGAGAHNWGSVKQEIEDINKLTDTDVTDKEESSNEQTTEQHVGQEDEEIKELTLDEWKALRGERTKPQFNTRKPNEGEDVSQWKQMVMLNKKKEGDSEEEYEYDPSMYPQRVGRLQRIVDIQFNFNDGRRGGGGFGRGRGRGPRPGGDNKGHRSDGERQPRQQRNFGGRQQKRSNSNALKVDDERQFPTLS